MDLAKVRIHKQIPTEKNPYVVVAAMWCSSGDFGGWYRTFRHKRIDSDWLLERDMDEQERHDEATYWRLHWYPYKTWEALIVDEWKITGNIEWVTKIFKASGLRGEIQDVIKNLSPTPTEGAR